MERLETKQVSGHTYYYYSRWAKVDGKCRRVWQKYLGKLQDIVQAVEGGGPAPQYAEVFQWGLPQALWNESCRAEVVSHVDRECPKRNQGLSTGEYLAIAALNRAICARSKRSLWDWFSQTTLLRHFPQANASRLTSQQFWNHMKQIAGPGAPLPETTLIFDKGNNSKDNFALVDELDLKFVGPATLESLGPLHGGRR
jgi:hypothetical protein